LEIHQERSRIQFSGARFAEEIELVISCSEGQFSDGFSSEAKEYIAERQRSARETTQALEGLMQRQ